MRTEVYERLLKKDSDSRYPELAQYVHQYGSKVQVWFLPLLGVLFPGAQRELVEGELLVNQLRGALREY